MTVKGVLVASEANETGVLAGDDRMLIDESSTRKLLTSTKLDDGTEFALEVEDGTGRRTRVDPATPRPGRRARPRP